MPIIKLNMSNQDGITINDDYINSHTIVSQSVLSNYGCLETTICTDYSGNIYAGSLQNSAIYKINPNIPNNINLIAGSVGNSGFANSSRDSRNARFTAITDICCDKSGKIYVADFFNSTIRKIDDGNVSVVAGNSGNSSVTDGNLIDATIGLPSAVVIDDSGTIYYADVLKTGCVRKIVGDQLITISGTVDGTGDAENVPASKNINTYTYPIKLALDKNGNVYVMDYITCKIKKIDKKGWVYLFSGDGNQGDSLGTAPNYSYTCQYSELNDMCSDKFGNIYVLDYGNAKIYRLNQEGRPFVVADFGPSSYDIYKLTIDQSNNLYVYIESNT